MSQIEYNRRFQLYVIAWSNIPKACYMKKLHIFTLGLTVFGLNAMDNTEKIAQRKAWARSSVEFDVNHQSWHLLVENLANGSVSLSDLEPYSKADFDKVQSQGDPVSLFQLLMYYLGV